MDVKQIRDNKLLDIFCSLVEIPSPSLNEEKVIEWIRNFCVENNISFKTDTYNNVFIKVEAKNPEKQPILLSAHMDVVGDFSPINLQIDGDFFKTDGKRTLGADDKAGVACALYLAMELKNKEIDHGGLEIVFTRDEEHGLTGIKHVGFSKIDSKYILVLDADKLGQLLISGASYTNAKLKVETTYGGHSGLDIQDENRLNAAKLICDLLSEIPQGVYYADETGTITSINLGTVIGGNIENSAAKISSESVKTDDYLDFFMQNAITNVINTKAQARYSIRSADVKKETELKEKIKNIVADFNKKYEGLAKAEIEFAQHLPPFEKADDDLIEKLHKKACETVGVKSLISSFHAGAETHLYAQNKNAKGENFIPYLFGTSDVYNMHSNEEKVNYKTLIQGYNILKELFVEFNSN